MLKEVASREKLQRRIAVCTGSDAFTQVLQRLMGRWGFDVCHSDDPTVLLLAEEGCCEPVAGQAAIWLSRSKGTDPERISLPVSVESLWQTLEQRFHQPTRMHLRMAVDLAARVLLRGEWIDTRLSSLSDMGVRFTTVQELVKQEQVTVELVVDEEVHQFHGQIIFSMAGGPAAVDFFHSGVVFVRQDVATCDMLRAILIRWYLELVQDGMDPQVFQSGLALFDLAPQVQQLLSRVD
jgi:hypothetical protein